MSESHSDDEAMLFGSEEPESVALVPQPLETERVEIKPFTYPELNEDSRILKLPASSLSVGFSGTGSKAANTILCRTAADGSQESNTRLIQWEDGSWSMVVGSEHFRVIERSEDVSLFDQQPSGYSVSLGSVGKQFNVIPASLDSRTHRHVVEQSAVARKLTETRKVALAHGIPTASSGGATVNTISVRSPEEKKGKQKLTAAFLEAGMGVRDIKASYKRPRGRKYEKEEEEEERDSDVDFIDDESESSESSSGSSESDTDSSSSSSSSGSSDSD